MKRFLFIIFLVLIGIIGCSNKTIKETKEIWEESPTLIREDVVTDDGQTEDFIFRIGDNGKFGFGEYGPFIAGENQKYMWHFWGKQETLTQPFKVIGINKVTSEEITVFEYPANSLAPLNGADDHIPSTMMLPRAGIWKLEAHFGEELFGNIFVNVEDK